MSNVTLSIGSRSFAVACADGEEAHVSELGRLIDEKVAQAGAQGQTEGRMLLFAALLLADEIHELRHRGGQSATVPLPPQAESPSLPEDFAERLTQVAGRIENIASLLEGEASTT
jgi:cell division protein ZapA